MSANSLFDSQFTITQIDPDGKKFDRGTSLLTVSRVIAHSSTLDMTLSLDIATDIYPVHVGQQLTFQLTSSLHRQKTSDDTADRESWRLEQPGAQGIAEEYDYVMYGKVRGHTNRRSSSTTSALRSRSLCTRHLVDCSWRSLVLSAT